MQPAYAGAARERKRISHVVVSPCRWKTRLGWSCPHAAQDRAHRQAEAPCKLSRLVEASVPFAVPVQGNGNGEIGALEHAAARRRHQGGERTRDRPPAVVLQGVHDCAERSFVGAYGAGARDRRAAAPAARTRGAIDTDCAPRWKRITATTAQRRLERNDRPPAAAADGPTRRFVERASARGARRRDHDSDQTIDNGAQHG